MVDEKNLSDLRIIWSDSWEQMHVDSEIKTAINLVVDKLQSVCGNMEHWTSPPFDLPAAFEVCNRLTALNFVYSQIPDFNTAKKTLTTMWREATQGVKELRSLSNLSHFLPTLLNPTLKGYFQTLTQRDRLIAQMDQAFAAWDVWLCPVAMTTAFTHRPQGAVIEIEGLKVPYFLANGGFTMLFNLTGHPVVVIPVGQTKNGLPIGIQIVGKRWQDLELLAIAEKIDQVIGNFKHPSGY
jgi:amidase